MKSCTICYAIFEWKVYYIYSSIKDKYTNESSQEFIDNKSLQTHSLIDDNIAAATRE